MSIELRRAKLEDAAQVHSIFVYYVRTSVATYYHEPPPIALFEGKIERSLADSRFPFYVAVKGGSVVGYAYGSEYRIHEGYRYTIEDSIFIHPDYQRQGLGRLLLGALIQECKRLQYRRLIAIFGAGRDVLPGTFKLHESFGFKEVGRLTGVGEKFGQMLDTPLLQLDLTA